MNLIPTSLLEKRPCNNSFDCTVMFFFGTSMNTLALSPYDEHRWESEISSTRPLASLRPFCKPTFPPVRPSVCLPVHPFVYLSVNPSLCPPRLSTLPPTLPSVRPSFHPSALPPLRLSSLPSACSPLRPFAGQTYFQKLLIHR